MESVPSSSDLSAVPVFPLPGVVLLPTAVLPLHIFEERYKAMTEAALSGDRQIAMALLAGEWQKNYHGQPAIEPVVCVGTILSVERLPGGQFNFLLQGHTRAKVVRELSRGEPFRRFALQAIPDHPADAATLASVRQAFVDLFSAGYLAGTAVGRSFAKLLARDMPTPQIADLIAFTCIDDPAVKQQLLADADVERRVQTILHHLGGPRPKPTWPTAASYRNPSPN